MKHWIIDVDKNALPTWLEAMPGAALLVRNGLPSISLGEPGIVWCRLRAGEDFAVLARDMAHAVSHQVVILCDDLNEELVMQALSLGAAGCCNTHAAPEVLRQIALVVGNGGLWIGQSLLQRLVGTTSRLLGQRAPAEDNAAEGSAWVALLSEREVQVARLVAGGASNKEVANQLAITERTVKAHLTAAFEKLGIRDRLQLSLRINGRLP